MPFKQLQFQASIIEKAYKQALYLRTIKTKIKHPRANNTIEASLPRKCCVKIIEKLANEILPYSNKFDTYISLSLHCLNFLNVQVVDKGRHLRHVRHFLRLLCRWRAVEPLRGEHLSGRDVQPQRPLHQLAERGRQLEAVPEQRHPCKHVQAKAGARHRHHQTTHVTQVAHGLCAHQRQQDIVVLLALVLVDCGDLVGAANEGVRGAADVDDVTDQVLLTVVRCQD